MNKRFIAGMLVLVVIFATGCNSQGLDTQIESLNDDLAIANQDVTRLSEDLEQKKQAESSLKAVLDKALAENEKLESELTAEKDAYTEYKEKMMPFEELEQAEAEARLIEAERIAAENKAAEEQAAEEAAAVEEARIKEGYETGLTFNDLARTPDNYIGRLVKFSGEVIQVIEGSDEINLRIAINGDYDKVILVFYSPAIVSQRVLEDDTITIYGYFVGMHTYESVMGGMITVPLVGVDKIDFK